MEIYAPFYYDYKNSHLNQRPHQDRTERENFSHNFTNFDSRAFY